MYLANLVNEYVFNLWLQNINRIFINQKFIQFQVSETQWRAKDEGEPTCTLGCKFKEALILRSLQTSLPSSSPGSGSTQTSWSQKGKNILQNNILTRKGTVVMLANRAHGSRTERHPYLFILFSSPLSSPSSLFFRCLFTSFSYHHSSFSLQLHHHCKQLWVKLFVLCAKWERGLEEFPGSGIKENSQGRPCIGYLWSCVHAWTNHCDQGVG